MMDAVALRRKTGCNYDVVVTDHALVRWLTRVHGVDMEGYRAQLAREVEAPASAGARSAKIGGNIYHFDGEGSLVTIVEPVRRRWPPRARTVIDDDLDG